MFPEVRFLGADLYTWMIVAGVVAAIVTFRLCARSAGLSYKLFVFTLIVALFAIATGYLSAVLFQSFYSYLDTGVWKWGTGATFYGGLIGAAALFLALYFGAGHFVFRDKEHIRSLGAVVNLAAMCIVIAHAIGRLGCLFAGCCYGKLTDGGWGLNMYVNGAFERRVPVQLFESLFLFLLFTVLLFTHVTKKNGYTMSVYLIAYGVWRFAIEYLRDDARGSSGISFLTPSQLTALLLAVLGVALIVLWKTVLKNACARAGRGHETLQA